MKSRSWSRGFVLACGISLLGSGLLRAQAAGKTPAIALLDSGDAAQWRDWTKEIGWRVVTANVPADANMDARVQAVAAAVQDAIRTAGADPARVYLAARGDAAAAVFYAVSRMPDVWAAGLALGGSPQAALDSSRVYAANFAATPVLWISGGGADEALAGKLKAAGMNLEWRSAAGITIGAAFEWLAGHAREEFPAAIDCETNSPAFASCFWIRMTKFDPGERNDVLTTSVIPGGTGAALDFGGFAYKNDDPGPGLLVASLPQKYAGPLKMGDRIVALDGHPIADAARFAETMAKIDQERAAVATIQRGKDRLRLDTRIVVPKRDAGVTARVQGKYVPEDKEIQIVSRTVTEMRVTVPAAWIPCGLYWNGLALDGLKAPGCIRLTIDKELLHAVPCEN
jgi:hypothetical protein